MQHILYAVILNKNENAQIFSLFKNTNLKKMNTGHVVLVLHTILVCFFCGWMLRRVEICRTSYYSFCP